MGSILWLASYPKSGNTWLRALLANYLTDSGSPADINALGAGGAATRRLFDELTGIRASALDPVTVDNLLPAVYRHFAAEESGVVHFKIHDMYRLTARGEPLFPHDVSAGVVYVVRNVLDVAISLAHHAGIDVAAAAEKLCDPTFTMARSEGALDDQLRQIPGSWSAHVSSWLDQIAIPLHLVRYEDMLQDPAAVFAEVVRFCGLPYDQARVHRAVAFSRFEELQRQEQADGFRERHRRSTASFFRSGKAGAGAEVLPSDLAGRLLAAHSETLQRCGYTQAPIRKEMEHAAYI